MKKNCENCKFLRYEYGDSSDGWETGGFLCVRKDFIDKEETEMLALMDERSYRERGKVCHRPKSLVEGTSQIHVSSAVRL